MNEARTELYRSRIEPRQADVTIRDLIEVFIRPLVDLMIDSQSETYYLRFLNNMQHHPRYWRMLYEHSVWAAAGLTIFESIKARIGGIPPQLIEARSAGLGEHLISSLAFLEATFPETEPSER